MNKIVIIVIAIIALAVIVLLFVLNQKDRKKLTEQLKQDYKKSKEEEGDIEIEDTNKI